MFILECHIKYIHTYLIDLFKKCMKKAFFYFNTMVSFLIFSCYKIIKNIYEFISLSFSFSQTNDMRALFLSIAELHTVARLCPLLSHGMARWDLLVARIHLQQYFIVVVSIYSIVKSRISRITSHCHGVSVTSFQ